MALAAMLALWTADAQAQTPPTCSNTPATGERIQCEEEAASTADIDIDAAGIDIDTTEPMEHGVHGKHEGEGLVDINVLVGLDANNQVILSAIDTMDEFAHGIYGQHTGTGNIDIYANFPDITTASQGARGVSAFHEGDGNIDIYNTNGSIETTGTYVGDDHELRAHGIYGGHEGFGHIGINTSNVRITTAGTGAAGIRGSIERTEQELQEGAVSNVSITATNVDVTTTGEIANGIEGWHRRLPDSDKVSSGNIEIDVRGGTVTTGKHGWGIAGLHASEGDISIKVRDSNIRTHGQNAYAIFGKREPSGEYPSPQTGDVTIDVENTIIDTSGPDGGANGIFGWLDEGIGKVSVNVRDTAITTNARSSFAVQARSDGIGDVSVNVRDTAITTNGTLSHGVLAHSEGSIGGDVSIDIQDSPIVTKGTGVHPGLPGTFSYGVYGYLRGDGDLTIDMQGGSVTTNGTFSHGIVAYHFGEMDTRSISVDIGGNVDVSGAGAQGIRVGIVNGGAPDRVAAIGADGYRQQTVTVNGSVTSTAEGVYLPGGGRVVIGPQGSIASDSGVAILATGTVPEVSAPDPNPDNVAAIPAIEPKLRVDMNLDGRRVAQVLGEGWIINDGGETTIAVNNVVLHEGATGVTGAMAHNGAWNVRMREEGVRVTDRTDPANWVVSEPAEGVVADRDFSAGDFNEARCPEGQVGTPPDCTTPPPPMCPEGQVGTPPDCTTPPPPMCPEGQVGTPPDCTTPPPPMCPEGQVGTPPDCTTPPPPMCPEGQVGTPPDCTTPPPPMCPEGQVGTPPDCTTPPPPMCPEGQVGTPPDCTTPPPPMCPEGQVGTPPDCTTPPPPMCPEGQVGTPPDCTTPPPPMCPEGQVGTPPDCTTPPPPMCPEGQVGMPPDCMTPPPPMCPEGQVGTPPDCTTPPPPMCPEGQVGTPPDCTTPPPPMCPEGQVGTPPNCTTPPPPMCPEGQVGTPPDCTTPPPPMCPEGQVGTPPDCTTPPPPMCPEGQVGTPPDCTTPPPPMCPEGQVGTPPDCTTPPPPMCPEGQVGTPPNCTTPPPPMCPEGQVGTPPDCTTPPPPMCPEGQVGTPPDCTTPPPPMCPEGQVGTPPDCTTPPPPMCPEGQVGTPPDCTTPPPPMCPEGQVGTPPNCTTPPPPMCPEGQVGTPPDCTTPPPPMCPEGQVGTPPDCTTPPPPMCPEGQVGTPPDCETPLPEFTEEYAPRAAVYEALPDFLLRLIPGGPIGERMLSPGSSVWVLLSESRGSHEPDRSTVGTDYDFERFAVEAGLDVPMSEYFTGSISLFHVRGSSQVSSPFGGGDIEAEGHGASVGASVRTEGGYYANGSLSLTDYDVDVSSGDINVGTLKRSASALGTLLNFEAGRRIEMSERLNLTPRAWMTRSEVSVDAFTDSVGARFSAPAATRFTGGVGVAAGSERAIKGGALSLRGSLDLAQDIGDAKTVVYVSGEKLESKSAKTRLILGLGGVYHMGRFSIGGEFSMDGLGSDDTQYSGRVSIGMQF